MIAFREPSPEELAEKYLWLAEQESAGRWRLRAAIGDDEVLSSAMFALVRAARSFDSHRQGEDGFEAYARQAIRNKFRDCAKNAGTRAWLTAPIGMDVASSDREYDATDEVRWALSQIGEPHASLLSDAFGISTGVPVSQGELASRHGVCQSTIYNRITVAKQEMASVILRERHRHEL